MTYAITRNAAAPPTIPLQRGLISEIIELDISSYTTSGEVLDTAGSGVLANLGLNEILWISGISTEVSDLHMRLNAARTRLLLIVSSTGSEAGNGSDGGTWILWVVGTPG